MKKTIAILSSLGILVAGFPQTAISVEASQPTQIVKAASESEVIKLTLDKVLKEAVDNSRNLTLLSYQYEILSSQRNKTKDSLDSLNSAPTIPTDINVIFAMIVAAAGKDLSSLTVAETAMYQEQARIQQMINNSLKPMMEGQNSSSQRKQLEDAIRQLESNMSKNTYDLIEARHGIQLMMAGRYTQLLATEQVQKLNEKQLNLKKRNMRGLEVRHQLGLISKDELSRASRELTKAETEFQHSQKQYELEVNKLLLDLDLPLNKKVQFEPIKRSELNKIYQTEKTADLIEDSLQLAKLRQDLYLKYSTYDISQEYQIIETQIEQARIDLEKKINDLYFEADKSYQAMLDKESDLQEQIEDNKKLDVRYKLGLVSKFDYDQAQLAVKGAELEYLSAQITYLMTKKQVEALEEGFIQ